MRPLLSFRLFGIPVDVLPTYLLVAVLSAASYRSLQLASLWFVIVTVSVLWHELGHGLAQRAFGFWPRIELIAMGGLTWWAPDADPSTRQQLLVSAAGPAANLLLGGAVWALEVHGPPLSPLAASAASMARFVNVGWALLNLLPILPLDGSHVCDHASQLVNGRREPRWVGWVSLIAGTGLVLFAITRHDMWLGFIGGAGALHGWRRADAGGFLAARRSRSPAAQARQQARLARSRGDMKGVVAALLPRAEVGGLPEADLADLVGALVRTRRERELVELVESRLKGFSRRADAAPLAQLAAEGLSAAGAHEEALAVAKLGFQQLRVPSHAYDAACHLVVLERHEEAMHWLRRAADAGLDCGALLLSDPALEPLRARADFFELVTQAGVRPGAA